MGLCGGRDRPYSHLEILGVSVVSALIAYGLLCALFWSIFGPH